MIEDAKAGHSLVVEGPPGTGKSQTIVNLIAELLKTDKTVLFVSQKLAALNVVKERLDKVGLGDHCLELHGDKTKKKAFLEELSRIINGETPDNHLKSSAGEERAYPHLEDLKRDLDGFVKALREPFGKSGYSPFRLIGLREKALSERKKAEEKKQTDKKARIDLGNNVVNWTRADLDKAKSKLGGLSKNLGSVSPIIQNPWKGCKPDTSSPSDQEEILTLVRNCKKNLNRLCEPSILDEVQWLGGILADTFKPEAMTTDVTHLVTELTRMSRKFFKLILPAYYRLRKQIASCYRSSSRLSDPEMIADLKNLIGYRNLLTRTENSDSAGQVLSNLSRNGAVSASKRSESFAEWIESFRMHLSNSILMEYSIELISNGSAEIREKTRAKKEVLTRYHREFLQSFHTLSAKIRLDYRKAFGKDLNELTLPELKHRVESWENNLSKIHSWYEFNLMLDECSQTVAAPLVGLVEKDELEPEELVPYFEEGVADQLLRIAMAERPALKNFTKDGHEHKIEEFSKLDVKSIELNRKILNALLYNMKPKIQSGSSRNYEELVLLNEINKKRNLLPIRALMKKAGGLIQKLKPCFMMGPASIAKFLDPQGIRFDVIIFDEASQVRPGEALGALLRGKTQAVVFGDTKQLPPTSFFDTLLQGEEPENETEGRISEKESILHLCNTAFPHKMLKWHYRSKHESLIAVSNYEFYDNRLIIFPSPVQNPDELGLKFVHLPHTIYDRGRSSVNRQEARTVAERVMEHFRRYPDKSLGVGTFNVKQQDAIEEEIEKARGEDESLESFFSTERHERFFVKNLEAIQGDERDVIFISVGFGKGADGRILLNFGPLNQDGGERRLNVLISRARERCVVFSNFRYVDLDSAGVSSDTPWGIRALRDFLHYAETRSLKGITGFREETDSPFEDSVDSLLRSYGYDVKRQVGCGGFRIDLAISDPNSSGYILGIECDGATYHRSSVARDRDRLRQQFLESQGWEIHRICGQPTGIGIAGKPKAVFSKPSRKPN